MKRKKRPLVEDITDTRPPACNEKNEKNDIVEVAEASAMVEKPAPSAVRDKGEHGESDDIKKHALDVQGGECGRGGESDKSDKNKELEKGVNRSFLEIGQTTRPLGHSLNVCSPAPPPFSAPVPPSVLLAKLNKFLPEMAAANDKLAATLASSPERAAEFDVTNCEDTSDPDNVVEMDVAFVPLDGQEEAIVGFDSNIGEDKCIDQEGKR